jgi:hypothetical protein
MTNQAKDRIVDGIATWVNLVCWPVAAGLLWVVGQGVCRWFGVEFL